MLKVWWLGINTPSPSPDVVGLCFSVTGDTVQGTTTAMSRNFHIELLIVIVAGAAFLLYKTNTGEDEAPVAQFGGVSLKLEYATTEGERQKGLGGRAYLAPDEGMLFVFPADGRYGFWMKDTLIPLDIFWLDSKGQVVFIAPEVATSTYPSVFYSPVPVRYVLETVAGFARVHDVATGTPLLLKNFPTVSK